MADPARITQIGGEVIARDTSLHKARITQIGVEVIRRGSVTYQGQATLIGQAVVTAEGEVDSPPQFGEATITAATRTSVLTDYLKDKVVGMTLLGEPFSAIQTVYFAVGNGTFFEFPEYTREVVQFGAPTPQGLHMAVTNVNTVQFTATANWTDGPTHMALFDAQIGGNMLYFRRLDGKVLTSWEAGDILLFQPGTVWFAIG